MFLFSRFLTCVCYIPSYLPVIGNLLVICWLTVDQQLVGSFVCVWWVAGAVFLFIDITIWRKPLVPMTGASYQGEKHIFKISKNEIGDHILLLELKHIKLIWPFTILLASNFLLPSTKWAIPWIHNTL